MSTLQGFWSYVHVDDQAEHGRISDLANDVAGQFEMLTGESLDLFLDKDAIKWGEHWRDKVDSSLASVAFFVPVMSPRYFMSPECRRELQFFARRAERLGIKELVLPLLYIEVPAFHDDTPSDDLIALIRGFQWEDWRDLRFVERTSEAYRRAVARMAERIAEANTSAEEVELDEQSIGEKLSGSEMADDSPGFLDQVATAEETLPKWTGTVETIGQCIEQVGRIMEEATADLHRRKAQTTGFAARLLVARELARRMDEPVERIWTLSNQFASQFHEVDEGFRAIIERGIVEVQENPESMKEICSFFNTVRELSAAVRGGLDSTQQMIVAIGPIEKLSRDLRPVLRRLRQGLTTMVEAREVSDEWVQLIENANLSCEDYADHQSEVE